MSLVYVIVLFFACCRISAIIGQKHNEDNFEEYTRAEVFTPPLLTYENDIGDGDKVWVFDNVVSTDDLPSLREIFDVSNNNRKFAHENYTFGNQNIDWNEGMSPWLSRFDKSVFEQFHFWKKMQILLKKTFNKEIYLEHVQGEFLRALDAKPMLNGTNCAKNRYAAALFVSSLWQKDNYGQISFYSLKRNENVSSEPRLEPTVTVHPKPSRMVVWPSCHKVIFHPPAINIFINLVTVNLLLSTNKPTGKEQVSIKNPLVTLPDNYSDFANFKFSNSDANSRTIDYKAHLTRSFFDDRNLGIYVFDNLFTPEELEQWKRHVFKYGMAASSQFDGSLLQGNDNVQWLSGFSMHDFVKTPMWKRVYDTASFVSGIDTWYPYDVSVNYIRSADHSRIHPDAEMHQHEYTYLLYLNENEISPNELGETVYFLGYNQVMEPQMDEDNHIMKFTGMGGDEVEPFVAIRPRYGRVVIFRNIIRHSARPFSYNYLGCRYTFAVKLGLNERLAYMKNDYEQIFENTGKLGKLKLQMWDGKHDDEKKSPLTLERLKTLDVKSRKTNTKLQEQGYQEALNRLLTPEKLRKK